MLINLISSACATDLISENYPESLSRCYDDSNVPLSFSKSTMSVSLSFSFSFELADAEGALGPNFITLGISMGGGLWHAFKEWMISLPYFFFANKLSMLMPFGMYGFDLNTFSFESLRPPDESKLEDILYWRLAGSLTNMPFEVGKSVRGLRLSGLPCCLSLELLFPVTFEWKTSSMSSFLALCLAALRYFDGMCITE